MDSQLIILIQKILERTLLENNISKYQFAPDKTVHYVSRLIENFRCSRGVSSCNNINRILKPHGWNGNSFEDGFGLNDLLEDLLLFQNGWKFLHYEFSKQSKLENFFTDISKAFLSIDKLCSQDTNITKVYYKIGEYEMSTFTGRKIYPSSKWNTEFSFLIK